MLAGAGDHLEKSIGMVLFARAEVGGAGFGFALRLIVAGARG
jgi:hypothetical protein